MNDDRLRAAYQSLIRRPAGGREGCPAPEALDRLVARGGPEAERLATLNHAMACSECRRELDLLRAVQRATRVATWRPPLFALAAVLMLSLGAILVWRAAQAPAPDVLRGSEAGVALLEPGTEARLAVPPRFVWRPVSGAVNYRVEVTTASGALAGTWPTSDTTLTAPAGALAPADSTYRWRVIAELRTGGSLNSGVRRLRVVAP